MNPVTDQTENAPIPDFEAALQKLSSIVENMENGKLTLENALQQFEAGVALARQCQNTLREAEQRIIALTES